MKKVAVVDLTTNQVSIKNIEDNQKLIAENDDLILNADECLKYKVFDEILE